MKICWDNLWKLRYDKKNGYWVLDNYTKYIYKESCIICGEPYLVYLSDINTSQHCSKDCLYIHNKELSSKRRHSKESKKKLSEAKLGNKNPMFGKKQSKESQRKRSESLKKYYREVLPGNKRNIINRKIALYDTYAPQINWCEEVRRDPEHYDWLQVRCNYSKCRRWFNPALMQARNRLNVLKGFIRGEQNFYCSEQCKQLCPVYNQVLYQKDHRPYSTRDPDYSIWSKMIKKRDNYECQICGSKENLIAHHFEGLNQNDIMSLDLEMGITLCKPCERKAHSGKGCTDVDMQKKNVC